MLKANLESIGGFYMLVSDIESAYTSIPF